VFAVGFSILGAQLRLELAPVDPVVTVVVFALVGVLIGLVLTPYITIRPVQFVRFSLVTMPSERLLAIVLGVFLGLFASLLFSFPLSLLPTPFKQILPFAVAVIFCYLGATVLVLRQNDLRNLLNSISNRPTVGIDREENFDDQSVLLDTSVIIDGRIADVSKTHFIRATLLVPNFVLKELQHIADSADSLRRNRGRRGLEILAHLQNDSPIPVRITDMDASEVRDVDSKLVALARQLRCPIMTNDYNLNRVAELQGVTVLNINDLANAVKAVYLPGEEMAVKIIQEGKETRQGVGYLDDGTMVVVEDGVFEMNNTVTVTVTKVLQTSAGRMIFARP
jgi:uncharacterized protein YacL